MRTNKFSDCDTADGAANGDEKKYRNGIGGKIRNDLLMRGIREASNYFSKLSDVAFALFAWLPWTLLLGTLPGLISWQLINPEQRENFWTNRFDSHLPNLEYGAVSSVLFFICCFVAYHLFVRGRNVSVAAFYRKVNRFASLLLIFPIYFFLESYQITSDAPLFSTTLCAGAGLIGTIAAYGIPGIGAVFDRNTKTGYILPLLLIAGCTIAWIAFIASMGLRHHANLGTAGWDFGLYINSIWNSLHGNPLGCSLVSQGTHASRHFDPILVLISPILLAAPGAEPETLIILQVTWVASGVVPLYLLSMHLIRNQWMSAVLVIVYLLHPAFHGPSIYDFHSLVLAGPIMLWCIYFLDREAPRRFFLSLGVLLLCREDMSVIALAIGLFALISGKSRLLALGTMMIAFIYGGIVYVAVFSETVSYSQYFSDIQMQAKEQTVASDIALIALTNPVYMLQYMLAEKKIVYILQLMAPLLFLPLFARKYWILFLFGLVMTLVGSKDCLFSISRQYSTWWLPFMFAALPVAIETFTTGPYAVHHKLNASKLRGALLIGLLLSAFAMSRAYGIFWPNPSFRAGNASLIREPDNRRQQTAKTLKKIKKMIPQQASVMASEHIISHFSTRLWIWSTEKKGYRFRDPDYGIIWNQDMRYRQNRPHKIKTRKKLVKLLHDSDKYKRILKENGISLYERKP
ncbi:MAG: DUF2079 domain-containing protein [Deltaproteobacteria bacterium]|nr:DUF2079 domain-containing protein [Deltaproteobacteria bacterium]